MSILSKSSLAATCFSFAALVAPQAHAGLLDDDEARKAILELRAKVDLIVQDMNTRIDTKANKSAMLEQVNTQEQMTQEIAKLRGQIEVLANELANTQKRQKDLYVDLEDRLRKLEPQKVSVDGKEGTVVPAEQKAFDAAMGLYKSADFKQAAPALADFVRRYPDSAYAANAQYSLGNAYYALSNYQGAILAHQVVVATYSTSPKAPDAMLNIASCYVALKDKKNARKWLMDLMAKFPGTSAAQAAKEQLPTTK